MADTELKLPSNLENYCTLEFDAFYSQFLHNKTEPAELQDDPIPTSDLSADTNLLDGVLQKINSIVDDNDEALKLSSTEHFENCVRGSDRFYNEYLWQENDGVKEIPQSQESRCLEDNIQLEEPNVTNLGSNLHGYNNKVANFFANFNHETGKISKNQESQKRHRKKRQPDEKEDVSGDIGREKLEFFVEEERNLEAIYQEKQQQQQEPDVVGMRSHFVPTDFELWAEKYRLMVEAEFPEGNEMTIELKLKEIWEQVPVEFQRQYQQQSNAIARKMRNYGSKKKPEVIRPTALRISPKIQINPVVPYDYSAAMKETMSYNFCDEALLKKLELQRQTTENLEAAQFLQDTMLSQEVDFVRDELTSVGQLEGLDTYEALLDTIDLDVSDLDIYLQGGDGVFESTGLLVTTEEVEATAKEREEKELQHKEKRKERARQLRVEKRERIATAKCVLEQLVDEVARNLSPEDDERIVDFIVQRVEDEKKDSLRDEEKSSQTKGGIVSPELLAKAKDETTESTKKSLRDNKPKKTIQNEEKIEKQTPKKNQKPKKSETTKRNESPKKNEKPKKSETHKLTPKKTIDTLKDDIDIINHRMERRKTRSQIKIMLKNPQTNKANRNYSKSKRHSKKEKELTTDQQAVDLLPNEEVEVKETTEGKSTDSTNITEDCDKTEETDREVNESVPEAADLTAGSNANDALTDDSTKQTCVRGLANLIEVSDMNDYQLLSFLNKEKGEQRNDTQRRKSYRKK